MPEWLSGDFETRSAIDLTKVGVYRYAEHPSTDAWCFSYAFDFQPIKLWRKGQPCPPEIVNHIKSGGRFKAWNAQFERTIWNITLGKHGWPLLPIEQTWCTQAQAVSQGYPAALDRCADALGLEVGKDQDGRKLMLQMCKPRLRNTDGTCLWWDETEKLDRLGRYCVRDTEVERTIGSRLRPVSDRERAIYVVDQIINERGYAIDFELVHAGLTMVGVATKQLDRDVRRLTEGCVENTRKRNQLLNWLWLHMEQSDVTNLDKYALASLLKRDDLTEAVRAVLMIRQDSAKSSNAKLHVMQRATCKDGRIHGTLQYYGAGRTGRWAGRLLQPHNFPKGHIQAHEQEEIVADVKAADAALDFTKIEFFHGAPLDIMASLLRGCIVAGPGKDLLVADWAAIEARILAWLAGQRSLLHLFATGGDPYKAMAAKVYRVLFANVTSEQRWLGKQLILGCGYQQGSDSLQLRLAKEGLDVDDEFAGECIGSYRNDNTAIVELWEKMDTAAKNAIDNPGVVYRNGKLAFGVHRGMLLIKLPSGRYLSYLKPTIRSITTMRHGEPWTRDQIFYWGVSPVSYQWEELYSYGGKLTENVVQAIARDVLADAMLRVEAAGYPVVLHVHDEVVSEVPEGTRDLEEFRALISVVPPELTGCPLKAEVWRGKRYRK